MVRNLPLFVENSMYEKFQNYLEIVKVHEKFLKSLNTSEGIGEIFKGLSMTEKVRETFKKFECHRRLSKNC